jgi:hypothetical protein
LRLATVLDQAEEEQPNDLVAELLQGASRGRGKKQSSDAKAELEAEHDAEVFYERMRLTSEIEAILGALYRDFLTLRLHNAWTQQIIPLLRSFAAGESIDAEAYGNLRRKLIRNAKQA